MSRLAAVGGGVAAAWAALTLVICGPMNYELGAAKELFTLALIAGAVAAGVLLRRGRWRAGVLLTVCLLALLALSFRPVYVEHVALAPWGLVPHRHTLWDLGHVH